MNVTTKQVLKYTFLPGFMPRLNALLVTGFQFIPYFVASVFGAVRLLPTNHPYLNPSNMGQFGVRHAIAEAANNLEFSKDRIDQVILFFTILVGMALVVIQFGLFFFMMIAQPAFATAMPTNFGQFFSVNNDQDISFIMLDMVFGIPDLFNSCISTGAPCTDAEGNQIAATQPGIGSWTYAPGGNFPMPMHTGLHELFRVYSYGLLIVAAFIALYFMMTVVAETAQSGTAFGKRFNKVWAPIRIVVAFGLLVPIGQYGINTSQYLVLYAAKYGAGFANTGWDIFTSRLATVHGIAPEALVAEPNIPDPVSFMQFLFTAKACQAAENAANATKEVHKQKQDIEPYMVRGQNSRAAQLQITATTTYDELVNFASGESQVVIRFGRNNPRDNASLAGFVGPTCGEFVIVLTDSRPRGTAEPGVLRMQEMYFDDFLYYWFDDFEGGVFGGAGPDGTPRVFAEVHMQGTGIHSNNASQFLPGALSTDYKSVRITTQKATVRQSTQLAIQEMQNSTRFQTDPNIAGKGWACAACLYNRIAEMNGFLVSSILNQPLQTRYPEVMESIYLDKRKAQKNVKFTERFKPGLPGGKEHRRIKDHHDNIANTLWAAFHFWDDGAASPHTELTGNAIIDSINAVLGTEGIFDMRRNANVHPIAQISSAGRSLVEASIRNLSFAIVAGGSGLAGKMLDPFIGETASVAAEFLITIAMVTLTAGFVLFYIVPFLPFIYFFFAFGGWVKGIFEAMVGAPLWALAHIRIDGNGLSGQAALSGYYLIFEVFLRPILMIFGLIASISIFAALVKTLNMIFELVVANVGGFDLDQEFRAGGAANPQSQLRVMRSAIDEFFFTVIYVVIVYMMGMSSFKLVDLIPNNILRWMGQSVATFGDQREDPTQKLVSTSTVGSQQATSAIGGGLQYIAKLGK